MPSSAASEQITDDLIQQVQKGSAQMSEAKAIALAGELYSRGRYQQAINVCRQMIQHKDTNADAHNILGVSLNALGQNKDGVAAIKRAIKLSPKVAAYHANLGEVLRVNGSLGDAVLELMEAVKLDPRSAQAHNNLGIARYEKKEYPEAVACYRRAIELSPKFPEAFNNLGNALRLVDDIQGAQAAYEQALALRETYPEAYNNLGTLLKQQGKSEQAEHALAKAIAQNPQYIDAYHNLAAIYHAENRDVDALRLMGEVLNFAPRNAKCLLLTARIQARRGAHDAAEKACRLVLGDDPNSSEAFATLGMIMHEIDRFPASIKFLEKALELDSSNAEARNFYGVALKSVGKLDEARDEIKKALANNDKLFGAYANLNDLVNFKEEEELFNKIKDAVETAEDQSAPYLLPMHYAYAKGLEDHGNYELALTHYIQGGRMKRAVLDYNEDVTFKFFKDIKAKFTKDIFAHRPYAGNGSDRPIFIVGMPRSGSTLVEQILSSHPDVFGAGEIKYLSKSLHGLRDRFPSLSRYPDIVTEMSEGQFELLADKYLEQILPPAGAKKKVTDKLLTNYFFVGLIHILFPNAKIINTRRDPIDTCLSAFTKLFKDDMPHSYDLGEIGRYYRQYDALMAHWVDVLPEGVMTQVQYEDVVRDTEGQARKLIEFLGLAWNDECLDFHKSTRPVKTASVAQVRKPIYNRAVERWRKYGDGLQPLIDALQG